MVSVDGYQIYHQILIRLETVEEIEDLDEDFRDDIFDNTNRVIKNTVSVQLWGKTLTLKESNWK